MHALEDDFHRHAMGDGSCVFYIEDRPAEAEALFLSFHFISETQLEIGALKQFAKELPSLKPPNVI